ncbi:MAG: hypothetical protein KDA60_14965 [Planctomycetales bacterium]|nr:hypothetical protein [Planctomycetales bacterium]
MIETARNRLGRSLEEFEAVIESVSHRRDSCESAQVAVLEQAAQRARSALRLYADWITPGLQTPTLCYLQKASRVCESWEDVAYLQENLAAHAFTELSDGTSLFLSEFLRDKQARFPVRIAKLAARMASDRFADRSQRILSNLGWQRPESEPNPAEFRRGMTRHIQNELEKLPHVCECEFTEWYDTADRLRHLDTVWELVAPDALPGRATVQQAIHIALNRLAPIVRSTALQMRGTKWQEQARNADELQSLRALVNALIWQRQQYFRELESIWESEVVSRLCEAHQQLACDNE